MPSGHIAGTTRQWDSAEIGPAHHSMRVTMSAEATQDVIWSDGTCLMLPEGNSV
ncbi:hypothetical protein SERLA73DRAFT_130387, partial [Serpula lacrymans var. lacrymans S7.3]